MRKDLNAIKKEFENYIEQHEAQLEAWQNVKRVTKKDGGDFSTLSKNFENAKIGSSGYSLREEKEIRVNAITKSGKYVDDYFTLSPLVKDSKHEIAEERVIKVSGLCAYYHMNVDEIEKAIEERTEMHKKYIASYKEQLELLEDYYTRITGQLEEIHKTLNEITPKGANVKNISLRYAMEELIKNYYFN